MLIMQSALLSPLAPAIRGRNFEAKGLDLPVERAGADPEILGRQLAVAASAPECFRDEAFLDGLFPCHGRGFVSLARQSFIMERYDAHNRSN